MGTLELSQLMGSKERSNLWLSISRLRLRPRSETHSPGGGGSRYRGPFSVLKGGKMVGNTKVMKNVANTSVLGWGERLFCLWEGGDPYEIDSRSLDTIGKFDVIDDDGDGGGGGDGSGESEMVGELKGGFWDVAATLLKPILYGVFNMPPKRLLSHCKIDAGRDRLLILSCNAEDMLLPCSHFTFYEFDSNFKMVQKKEFNIPDHLMIHDWAFTDSHYILFGNRIKLDITGSMAAVFGLSPMISALAVNPSKPTSPIYLLPRSPLTTSNELNNGNERDWRVPIEAPSQMWVLHVGNAFENRDDDNANSQIHIQASVCSYRWFNFQKMFGYDWQSGKLDPSMMNRKEENLLPHLVQVSINLDANGECQECSVKSLNEWKKASDFPVINQDYSGAKNTYIYAATTSGSRQALPHFPFDTVLKLNTLNKSIHTWSVGSRRFIGEPIFVPKGTQEEEDNGYILVIESPPATIFNHCLPPPPPITHAPLPPATITHHPSATNTRHHQPPATHEPPITTSHLSPTCHHHPPPTRHPHPLVTTYHPPPLVIRHPPPTCHHHRHHPLATTHHLPPSPTHPPPPPTRHPPPTCRHRHHHPLATTRHSHPSTHHHHPSPLPTRHHSPFATHLPPPPATTTTTTTTHSLPPITRPRHRHPPTHHHHYPPSPLSTTAFRRHLPPLAISHSFLYF
ncbi:hypothetical protein HYC85_010820 [Camellia sinensis]|uniref:Uncharacterized protein n=1 Tax=Camellia sinensis TaxID=4442 RepID=A0A7J7HLQ6_CAMSI|nr:hypothetical protein HYC85_010820 [Camellia sinensis]